MTFCEGTGLLKLQKKPHKSVNKAYKNLWHLFMRELVMSDIHELIIFFRKRMILFLDDLFINQNDPFNLSSPESSLDWTEY